MEVTLGIHVKFFWDKSSAWIEWPELGASFEQDSSTGELAAGQAGILVLEDAPIVISAEGFRNLLFGVFVVYLKPISMGVAFINRKPIRLPLPLSGKIAFFYRLEKFFYRFASSLCNNVFCRDALCFCCFCS